MLEILLKVNKTRRYFMLYKVKTFDVSYLRNTMFHVEWVILFMYVAVS